MGTTMNGPATWPKFIALWPRAVTKLAESKHKHMCGIGRGNGLEGGRGDCARPRLEGGPLLCEMLSGTALRLREVQHVWQELWLDEATDQPVARQVCEE